MNQDNRKSRLKDFFDGFADGLREGLKVNPKLTVLYWAVALSAAVGALIALGAQIVPTARSHGFAIATLDTVAFRNVGLTVMNPRVTT